MRRTGELAAVFAAVALAAPAAAAPRLEVVLDRATAWEGEQVTATLRVVSAEPLTGYEAVRAPRLDGFAAEELAAPTTLAFEPVREGGALVRSYLVRRLALFPRRAGRLRVEGAEAEVKVEAGSDALGLFPQARRERLRAAPVSLDVRPLPPGAPPGFPRANVGRWRLEAEVDPPRPRAGEPFTWRVTARGEGDLRALALPELPDVPGARAFRPATSDAPRVEGGRFGGARAVEVVLVAGEGALPLPALALPFFDPARAAYDVARSPPLLVRVLPAAPAPPAAAPPPAPAPPAPLPLAPVAAAASAAAALAWALRAARARRRPASPAEADARAFADAALEDLARGETGGAAALARALEAWSAARLGRPVAGLTRAALARALDERGLRGAEVARALAACDAARFGAARDAAGLLAAGRAAAAALRER